MPIRTKWGGTTWQGPVADGNLRLKWGGSSWVSPGYARVKAGSGAGVESPPYGGSWVDTSYRGYPLPPSMPWVQQWDYSQTLTGFNGPSGGGPAIDFYNIERLDANGTPVEGYNDTSGSRWWGTPQDTRHQFRVRSHGVNGLYSGWVGNLRVGIGHPSTPNYGYVQRTRGWYQQIDGVWGRDQPFWIWIPNAVHITAFHYGLYTPMSGQLSPGTNRKISFIATGADWGNTENWPSPYNGVSGGHDLAGGDNYWGYVARGAGWSTTGNSYYSVNGGFGIEGTEYYQNYEVVSYNPEQGNYYW